MYAVEKLSSYITRGVYTVSAPFHPFGGAVDIIVVQQQDGSFKSSPWYVRFGKFQGVLKAREKVVAICVNGVEAGFHMYLDHKGEAYFLKECDSEEGVAFEMSPPSSGDEMHVDVAAARFKKVQSCNYDANRVEPIALENGNGKIVMRTASRRSRIFGLMFGSKSMNEKDQGVNVEMANSLERAEIAADLLETKWSTNLPPSGLRCDNHMEKNDYDPMEKSDFDVTISDKEMVSTYEDGTNDKIGTQAISEEQRGEVEVRSSSIVAPNHVGDDPNCCLSYDDYVKESVDSHDEKLVDGRLSNMTGEVHFGCLSKLVDGHLATTHEEVIEFNTLKTDDLGDRIKLIPESVMIDYDELNVSSKDSTNDSQSHGSVAGETTMASTEGKHDVEKETGDARNHGSAADEQISALSEQKPDGEKEGSYVSNAETLWSSTVGIDVSIQTPHTLNLFSEVSGTLQEHICEGTSRPESEKAINRENYGKCYSQDVGSSRKEDSFNFQDSQAHSPSNAVSFQDTSRDDSNSDCQKSCFSEFQPISQERQIIELPRGKVSGIEAVDFIENHFLVIEDASGPNRHVPEHNDISIISNEGQKFQSIEDSGSGDKQCLQNKLTVGQDESRFQIAESLEDEQFQFSDIDSFSVKQINLEVQVNNAAVEMDDNMLFSTEGHLKEHTSEDKDQDECFDNVYKVSGSQTSPISIPKSTLPLGETGQFAKSLPIIRSQIHDIDRSNLLHPLSCSLDLNSDSYGEGLLEMETSSLVKLVPDPGNDMLQYNHTPQAASKAVDYENNEGHNVIPINSAVDMSLCKHLLFEGMGADVDSRVFEANKELMPESQGMFAVDQDEKNADPSRVIVPSGGTWRLWPFCLKKSRTISTIRSLPESTIRSLPENNTPENVDFAPPRSLSLMGHDDIQRINHSKKKVRSRTPTSEELASLNLKEGRNIVTFSFSTTMLGQQQVDARIYLWKWNTRIVISDVDGTITKSDVLGQFMPLVGKDWSQTGVAHLFSAIKENGYQWLFLSARAISQAYLTRQFLLNLKQDGKALPDGPVVISPDGLFPSLYREVIRRAPHEFKISCLEDIRALFPRECSPFYAGFGNRDTDEISYLKVGVPKGKIFIINPKGEVAVNRRIDTKSYTSLHAQVNGMFPPVSTTEQEAFNSWNYWKLPLPYVDI